MILLVGIYGGIAVQDNRITQQELIALFGENMPMEAAALLMHSQLPVDEIRVKLREIAKTWGTHILSECLRDLVFAAEDDDLEAALRIRSYILENYQKIS